MPPVEARGVAGAVSGNWGGSIFMGRGNRDARCFRRPKPKRVEVEPRRCGAAGRVLVSNETCPPELPSEPREDSDARCVGGASAGALSAKSRVCESESERPSGRCWLVEERSPWSSSRSFLLFFDPSGPLRFLSMDLRRRPPGRSTLAGSKERRRRANCCRRLRFLLWWSSCSVSMKVGGVVMMAGAARGNTVSARPHTTQHNNSPGAGSESR